MLAYVSHSVAYLAIPNDSLVVDGIGVVLATEQAG
jgi:hypothetical protein